MVISTTSLSSSIKNNKNTSSNNVTSNIRYCSQKTPIFLFYLPMMPHNLP